MGQFDSVPGSAAQEVDIGKEAEQALLDALALIPGMQARHSTPEEDSGLEQIVKGDTIDAVAYVGGKPAFWVAMTTARDSVVRDKKIRQFMSRPLFKRVEGVSIPRAFVYVDAADVRAYVADRDITKHSGLRQKIMDDLIQMLSFAVTQTKIAEEKSRVGVLVKSLQEHRAEL